MPLFILSEQGSSNQKPISHNQFCGLLMYYNLKLSLLYFDLKCKNTQVKFFIAFPFQYKIMV